jgi:rRNA maturation protein Nop10
MTRYTFRLYCRDCGYEIPPKIEENKVAYYFDDSCPKCGGPIEPEVNWRKVRDGKWKS